MRGRPGCPTGQKKNSVGATGGSLLFSTRKGWVQDRPLIRPSVRTGAPSPRGEGFGGGKPSFRVSDTCRPTDSPGWAHPAGPGGSPQTGPKGPTNLSAPPTRPAGHASQSSAGRSRRKRMKSFFDRLCRPKNSSQPQVCPQGAHSGCSPNFGRGQKPSRKLDTPVHYLLERSRSPGAPSKILFYGDPFKI